jgi:carotenoid cleavage dioxygenase-like enzyme
MTFKVILTTGFVFAFAGLVFSQPKDLPAEYKQILPRGQIAAITQPQFVPAHKAKIADDSWVLGVVIDGQARAYSLNLLNSHEVVNDQIGEQAFAAVW